MKNNSNVVVTLQALQQSRQNMISILQGHTLAENNLVPAGLSNNLLWHAGHTLLSQQFLMYHLANLTPLVDMGTFIALFGAGTKPDGTYDQPLQDTIIELLQSTAEQASSDFATNQDFEYTYYYSEYFGLHIRTIEDAIAFNLYHEGVHFGHMVSIHLQIDQA